MGTPEQDQARTEKWSQADSARWLREDNHRLREAIGKHRQRIISLGHDGKGNYGTEWDRELWASLVAFATADETCACDQRRGLNDGRCVECGRPA